MDLHVPACSTIQLSILRQIKFILVHPGGDVQLACGNGNVFSYRTGDVGNFQDKLLRPPPLERNLQVCLSKVTYSKPFGKLCGNLFKYSSLLALTSLYPIVMRMDFLYPVIILHAIIQAFLRL